MATRATALLTSLNRVTTPDGARTGVVESVFVDGYRGDQPGQTTVRFQRGTVVMTDGTRKPKYWATEASTTLWQIDDDQVPGAAAVSAAEMTEGLAVADGITADTLSGDLFT